MNPYGFEFEEHDPIPIIGTPVTDSFKATGTKPRTLVIREIKTHVNSWVEVLEGILLYVVYDRGIEELIERYPKFINDDPNQLRRPRWIEYCYFETNLSAIQIYNFCVKVMEEYVGMFKGIDWEVFL